MYISKTAWINACPCKLLLRFAFLDPDVPTFQNLTIYLVKNSLNLACCDALKTGAPTKGKFFNSCFIFLPLYQNSSKAML